MYTTQILEPRDPTVISYPRGPCQASCKGDPPRTQGAPQSRASALEVRASMSEDEEDDDFTLLALWRGGDSRAGNNLYDRHFDAVRRFFINSVSDREREDLTQETFTRLTSALPSFEGRASFRTFTLRIARYVLYDHLRRRYRGKSDFDPLTHSVEDDSGLNPSRIIASLDRHTRLLHCVRRLPTQTKLLLELYYWQGVPPREIAKVFEIKEVTVRGRLRTARLALQADLQQSEEAAIDDTDLEDKLYELGKFFTDGPCGS
ncbi:sigma-70 family RNA polymerase sigma factor [Pseudenhygromyxa sp. WMMC2535]|uniref:RNA polymerase sigma factor n=1 Tax=Pseudenhygromyxa sp. WMMC2535 TaxID=2712867 RepID=UPI0015959132|nr:sigma-70 family RNA polymerase sigma factor [Pseudenhygromyxa sp. WMMC2535]NVB39920.1 sigma-70 family RNA polymerase sigma factor [Pseudenhygromyxa sp. WMMC2535]